MTFLVTGAAGHLGALAVEALLDAASPPATSSPPPATPTGWSPSPRGEWSLAGWTTTTRPRSRPPSRGWTGCCWSPPARSATGRPAPDGARGRGQQGVELVAYTSILRADSTSIVPCRRPLRDRAGPRRLGLPHVLLRNGWYLENYTAQVPSPRAAACSAGQARAGSAPPPRRLADAAAVALLADDSAGKIHELAGDDVFTMADYAATLAEYSGQEVTYVDLPQAEYAAALVSAGYRPRSPRSWPTATAASQSVTSTTTPAPSARSSAGPRRR